MEIEKAFKRLLIKNPFYGLFCLSLPKEVTRKVKTLCVTRNGVSCQLNINPDFWEQHTDDEQIALLTHELSHIALQHMFISSSFADSKIFDYAADAEINSYISNLPKDAVTPTFISSHIGKQLSAGLGTKTYYEEIKKWLEQQQQQKQSESPQSPCNGGNGGDNQQQEENPSESSSGDDSSNQNEEEQQNTETQEQQQQENESEERQYPEDLIGEMMDDHSTWREFQNLKEANKQLISNNINSILKATAEEVEKNRGTIPGELTEIIENIRKKKPEIFNWKAYFRRMLGSIYDVNIRSTRRKPSKRFPESAGIQHRKKVSIMVAVDTSGSVYQEELEDFFSEINYIHKAGAKVTVVQFDTRITSIEEYDGKNIPQIKGRGGTDFNPPVEHYKKNIKDYASLIFFTDGYAEIPEKCPQGMVWVITSGGLKQKYPGKVLFIPKQQNQ